MSYMFSDCSNLTSINLENFDTSKVENMSYMFSSCSRLNSINLENFDTSKVEDMSYMFKSCKELTSINLKNFITSQVENIEEMFCECSRLTSLNLINFDTFHVKKMKNLFKNCSNLTSINLESFNTSQIKLMYGLFYGCSSLISINLVNFNTSKVTNMGEMFNGCSSLISIDLQNFDTSEVTNIAKMFSDCSRLTSINLGNFDTSKVKSMNNIFYNCKKLEYINLISFTETNLQKNTDMFKNVPTNCTICINKANTKNKIFPLINGTYILNCSFLLNYIEKNESSNLFEIKKISNSIQNINEISTSSNSIQNTYETNIILNSIQNRYSILTNIIYNNNEIQNIINNISNISSVFEIFENIFINNYNTSNIDSGNDDIFTKDKITVTFSTTTNQKDNINNNKTIVDIGKCEELLRKYYNINENENLYIKKIDLKQDGMKIPKIEYDIYMKISETQLKKLNLSICKNTTIFISLPAIINGNIDIYNKSSDYYKDICYSSTSDNGTDIIISDRQNEYINKTLCQENCDLTEYNYTNNKAKCSCKVKESSFIDININKTELYKNFINIRNVANFHILKCFNKLFSKVGLITNINSYIIAIIFLLHIVFIIIF